ncbi:MAG: hypothetical protein N3C61_01180 [Candidatus Micrarchaeota archaeon]|nr:hypothetical protein [Candidatus Micrarchaeota archaeon]
MIRLRDLRYLFKKDGKFIPAFVNFFPDRSISGSTENIIKIDMLMSNDMGDE